MDEPPISNESYPSDDFAPDDRHAESTRPTVQIGGAGSFGMAMLLVSLSILFIASMVAYLVIRAQVMAQPPHTWPPPGMPRIPNSLWISTAVILSASVTIQMALSAVRRDDQRGLVRYLVATFIVGVVFLGVQTLNWIEFYQAIRQTMIQGAYLGMFFVLTGLHAAHVIGGLVPLGMVIGSARKGRYSRNFHPGVRYVTVYWHFLDVIWVVLFAVLYF